jgi:hypothetical protein
VRLEKIVDILINVFYIQGYSPQKQYPELALIEEDMRPYTRSALLITLIFSTNIFLAQSPQQPPGASPPDGINLTQNILKVTISSSRSDVSRNETYGVYADLENVSSRAIEIRPNETVLVVLPEVGQALGCIMETSGLFPTEISSSGNTPGGGVIIQPNEHYKVFWNLDQSAPSMLGKCPKEDNRWAAVTRGLGFVPGDYVFTVEGKIYPISTPGGKNPGQYHTYTESKALHVSLSQLYVMFAAAIGAFFAFLVVRLRDNPHPKPFSFTGGWQSLLAVGRWLRQAFSAALLGATITILASRLATTQFPIRVSVDDVWGAIAIGFVSYFIGNQFIDRVANLTHPASQPSTAMQQQVTSSPIDHRGELDRIG